MTKLIKSTIPAHSAGNFIPVVSSGLSSLGDLAPKRPASKSGAYHFDAADAMLTREEGREAQINIVCMAMKAHRKDGKAAIVEAAVDILEACGLFQDLGPLEAKEAS